MFCYSSLLVFFFLNNPAPPKIPPLSHHAPPPIWASPAATMLDSLKSVRRGGRAVNVGAGAEPGPGDVDWLVDEQIQLIGSNWVTPRPGPGKGGIGRENG